MYICSVILKVSVMISYWFNEQVLSLPVRLAGSSVTFRVAYSCGVVRDFSGRVGSLSGLRRALVSRLSSDSSVWCVQVVLSSGLYLCECSRRGRA